MQKRWEDNLETPVYIALAGVGYLIMLSALKLYSVTVDDDVMNMRWTRLEGSIMQFPCRG